jgi:hypothetical protein
MRVPELSRRSATPIQACTSARLRTNRRSDPVTFVERALVHRLSRRASCMCPMGSSGDLAPPWHEPTPFRGDSGACPRNVLHLGPTRSGFSWPQAGCRGSSVRFQRHDRSAGCVLALNDVRDHERHQIFADDERPVVGRASVCADGMLATSLSTPGS